MSDHEKINYLEIPARDINAARRFFSTVFGWSFTDYGPDYVAVSNAGMDVGLMKSSQSAQTRSGSILMVFYSEDLGQTQSKIIEADGIITKPVFEFPGGRRFHFNDPNGNEYAVWSDK